jgi:hypothetical protein
MMNEQSRPQPPAQGAFTSAERERSWRFDRYKVLRGPRGEAAVDAFMARLVAWEAAVEAVDGVTGEVTYPRRRKRARRAEDRASLRAAMAALLANLYASARHRTRPDQTLAVSFRNDEYPRDGPRGDRYRRSPITIGAMRDVRAFLTEVPLVHHGRGYQRRDTSQSRTSRMRALPALLANLEGLGVGLDDIGSAEGAELVILKGKAPRRGLPKPLMQYEDSDDTRAWRRTLTEVNALLDRTTVAYPPAFNPSPPHDQRDEDDPNEEESPREAAGDLTAKALRRIFNNGSWNEGGRLYGGHWEAAHKDWRRRLTIDGETTVELDFKALHPHLLYIQAGAVMPDDPYTVSVDGRAVDRGLGKVTFQRLLNGTSGRRALRCEARDREALPEGVTFRDFVAALRKHNSDIEGCFGNGEGLRLQKIDSDMAMYVLRRLSCERGIAVLPVHDSFIAQAKHGGTLWQAMEEAFGLFVGPGVDSMIREVGQDNG